MPGSDHGEVHGPPIDPRSRHRFDWHPEPELIGIGDPNISRAALEELGANAWQAALDYLYEEATRRPIGPDTYAELRQRFFAESSRGTEDGRPIALGPSPAPRSPATSVEILEEFRRRLSPYQLNAYHPGAFSYFTPPPLVMSIVGELLTQVTNQGIDVWHAGPSGAFVEEEVVRWLCDAMGYGPGSFGVLTSGGVMANFMAMAVMRDVHLPKLLAEPQPPRGGALEGVRVYASDQTHFSIARALDELGFRPETLHLVPADDRFRLRAHDVAEAIAADRSAGLLPACISAVAGSTNTGSVDAIDELADLAEREGLWLHVDAAYGGAVKLSARDQHRVGPLDRADSITVDPHKWLYQAYDIGALLVHQRRHLGDTFHRSPEYYRGGLRHDDVDPENEPLNFYQLGMEGTRRWRALKLWMSWKHLGTDGLARLIEANIDLAAYLARRCAESDDFESILAIPELSVVCFRHLPGGRPAGSFDANGLDRYEDGLQRALEISGEGWLSTTRLRGATYLRAGIVNYLSTEADVDRILAGLRRLSPQVARDAGIAD